MPKLSVSTRPCLPGRPVGIDGVEPGHVECATCKAPGGDHGELLEKHVVSDKKTVYLCPLCHVCLHLDFAGRINAGKIIWLPELSQAELNILMLGSFVVIRQAGVNRKNDQVLQIVDQAKRLYKQFWARAEILETALSGDSNNPAARSVISSPAKIASLLIRARGELKLDQKDVAKRMDGLRLLPDPKVFEDYIGQVSKIALKKYPPQTWIEAVEAESKIDQSKDSDGHFDASELDSTVA